MTETMRVVAGECTTDVEGRRERTERGQVVVLVKPDRTVLVHDADGYQPVAWLTRPESLAVESAPRTIVARDGDQRLRVTVHDPHLDGEYPVSEAGIPVGGCPDCGGALVRAGGAVHCTGCGDRYGLPAGATVTDGTCEDCDLPRLRTERGAAFGLCIDRDCESLDERVRERFGREWACPDCDGDLRILRRGGLIAGCENYPDCETGFAIPKGVVTGECACGLPTFETAGGERCLDATCGRP
jgi:DNA topoisomerase-1